ncbi:MAG: DUF4956 domain-containing protein [Bacteroidales bacterium]|nr:DUF4956 domain-containing protein [Bacteroidales bacterium]
MLTNYFRSFRVVKLAALLFIFFLLPVVQSNAALPAGTGIFQTTTVESGVSESDAETTTVEKKKDKIQINQNFYVSLLIDLAAIVLIIVFVYYPNYKKMDTIFTFIMFNVVIFLLTFVLNKVKISMGAAFGLFAVFSMLRYRTAGIGIKDMTYLFIFIALGLISGIQLEYHELGIIVVIIFIVTLLLDTKLIMKKEYSNILRYEKIEMIKPDKRAELINELKQRTGLNIHRVSINEIDFLKDTAMITYYYYE